MAEGCKGVVALLSERGSPGRKQDSSPEGHPSWGLITGVGCVMERIYTVLWEYEKGLLKGAWLGGEGPRF